MSCIERTPTTVDEWVSTIDHCAASYGGPNWQGTAILGLAALVVIVLVCVAVYLVAYYALKGTK